MIELIVCGLLWAAGTFTLIAALGVARMPDVLLRMHAAAKAGTVGVICCLIALSLYADDTAIRARSVLIALFLCITTPIVAQVLARAALNSRAPLFPRTDTTEWRAHHGAPPARADMPED